MTETTAVKSTAYDPSQIEARWYAYWETNGFFRADADSGKPPFVIPMPPPNVTGRLHMGHALQDSVQDALIRMRRMQGFEVLWIPGMDHAGIATQNVVERKLREEEGLERKQMGREAFIERVWDWKEQYGDIILDQKKKLGDSADWSRSRFTMDEGFSRAVQTVFVMLFEQGLIYRGNYLVNWDPDNMTAISDEEVDNVERDGHLWWIRYPLASGDGHITIATTRPETMLADTAIAVHPEDERYAPLIGQQAILPLMERPIPIIADDYVRPEFGAGALKVTPAHDANDFEIGKRHGLEVITAIAPDATINEEGGAYAGLDRFVARKRIVADLDALGLLEKVEDYKHSVPISSRSKALIEPLISRQWFVKMKPLAEPALNAVRDGTVTFYPDRWKNEYFRWLDGIRDWTISRQLWWGHRIPVWYYTTEGGEIDETRDFVVSVDQPEPGMVQDADVLDTWFSSWLWPFATLGWPEETDDLEKFYPSTVLVSGYDILFFWIARMIMAGQHFTDQVPYTDIFITGMIKDKLGRWMSKSLGNGIDPLDMIEQYGADAVRFSLVLLCAQGQDIKLDPTKFEMGRNFANKIWNAFNVFGRFMEEGKGYRRTRTFDDLDLVERWILTRLNETIHAVDEAVSRYRLNEAVALIYDLFWGDYCDWYLELIKPAPGEAMDDETLALAVEVYEQMVQLLHPFMPFITEDLWHRLRPRAEREACIVAPWPTPDGAEKSADAEEAFQFVQDVVGAIRQIRSQYNVPPAQKVTAVIRRTDDEALKESPVQQIARGIQLAGQYAKSDVHWYITRMARLEDVSIQGGGEKPKASAAAVVGQVEVFVPLAGMIDLSVERERLEKEIAQKAGFLKSVEGKLRNENFVSRAPAEVVEKERQKAEDAKAELEKLRANLSDLG
ncbi:MAG: valine--tRNA ligase [Rhodothermaceae bacterium]|nr:valine--tRNA ligase [Rhodothermaceae bacterium]